MDINRADREQLMRAFQVDGTRAEYIIRKRAELGGFRSWEDVKREVPGFEDRMVANLKEAGLTVGGQEQEQREPKAAQGTQASGGNRSRNQRVIDLNQASAAELERAFQVDGTRAAYIVSKREELGGFSSWDELKGVVPSFEEGMVENLRQAGFELGPKRTSERAR
jgi:DNA uptake protein ComE-like DNA-binding protein